MREEFREQNRNYPTIFIDNLHHDISKRELFQIIKGSQKIIDIFISKKKRVNTKLFFGFVRVENNEEVEAVVNRCNGKILRGLKIFAKPARFGPWAEGFNMNGRDKLSSGDMNYKAPHPIKEGMEQQTRATRDENMHVDNGRTRRWGAPPWCDGRSFKDVVAQTESKGVTRSETKKEISLKMVERKVEWLNRSIIVFTKTHSSIVDVEITLKGILSQEVEVSSMGNYKFIVTFKSSAEKKALPPHAIQCMNNSFAEIKDWSPAARCNTRRVWLEIHGLPVHLWDEDNFKQIAEQWGDVLSIQDISKVRNFEVAMVEIETLCYAPIKQQILVRTENHGIDVFVREGAKPDATINILSKDVKEIFRSHDQNSEAQKSTDTEQMNSTQVVPETQEEFGEVLSVPETHDAGLINNNMCHKTPRGSKRAEKEQFAAGNFAPEKEDNTPKGMSNNKKSEDNVTIYEKSTDHDEMGHFRCQKEGSSNNNIQKAYEAEHSSSEPNQEEAVLKGKDILALENLDQDTNEASDSLVSDDSIPPGFNYSIPFEVLMKAREKKKKASKTMQKFLRRKRVGLNATEIRRHGKRTKLPDSMDPAEVLHFANSILNAHDSDVKIDC